MIWIHGGSYDSGYSNRRNYGPKFIVKHNVLLVTFNYRVNIYGFLNLNTTNVPGNAGIRDQLAALKWIKRNIVVFGGDPNNITLFGESTGASSVEFLMLSGLADDLFHKAIMQSGTIFSDWMISEPQQDVLLRITSYLGLHTNDQSIAFEFLKQAKPDEVVTALTNLNLSFGPSIEQIYDGVEPIIRTYPSNLIKSEPYKSIPILCGFNDIEIIDNYETSQNYLEKIYKDYESKLINYFDFNENEKKDASKFMRDFYLGHDQENRYAVHEILEFLADFTFIHPLQRSTAYHINNNNTSVFQYIFSYSSWNILNENISNNLDNVGHGKELAYLFNQNPIKYPVNDQDELIVEYLTTMWTNFAKYS